MLSSCVRLLNQEHGERADLVYFDSDCIDSDGRKVDPAFRPEYDPDLLRKVNYMGNVILVRTDKAVRLLETMSAEKGERTVLDRDDLHEFLKRFCAGENVKPGHESDGAIRHIPRILYHEILADAKQVSVDRHVPQVKKDMELVSVIIPNKDHAADLSRCIDSIRSVNAYTNLEIIIVENNSSSREIFDYYDKIRQEDDRVRVLTYTGPFNYSRINNFGAREAKGKYLLFLNNDTVILSSNS